MITKLEAVAGRLEDVDVLTFLDKRLVAFVSHYFQAVTQDLSKEEFMCRSIPYNHTNGTLMKQFCFRLTHMMPNK